MKCIIQYLILAAFIFMISPLAIAQDMKPLAYKIIDEPLPETGAWFARDDSKTGFFLEIQNGILAGAFFGFNDAGDDVWTIFSSQLEPVIREDTSFVENWRIEANLLRFTDGGCILDCVTAGINMPTHKVVGQIAIEFNGRSQATFSIDDGPEQVIVPMAFGSGGFVEFPEASDLLLPVLTGTWVGEFRLEGNRLSLIFEIDERETTGSGDGKKVIYPVKITGGGTTTSPGFEGETSIVCAITNSINNAPICDMSLPPEVFLHCFFCSVRCTHRVAIRK